MIVNMSLMFFFAIIVNSFLTPVYGFNLDRESIYDNDWERASNYGSELESVPNIW